ncbi:MAG: hypothetical protein ACR2MU_05055 [Gaiellaceae bacterium]
MSPENQIVTLLSRWLARHLGDEELREGIQRAGTDGLGPEGAELVEELVGELGSDARGEIEMLARETLEALALGA